MGVFPALDGHEQVVYGNDPETGLRAIVALYSTTLGPALGGTRFYPYESERAALTDVLRLSKAMAYKNAAAGLDHGGGKAVIIGDPGTLRGEGLLRAYGRFIDSLGGRYVTACDVGTKPGDMAIVRRETRWATGATPEAGGSGDSGVLTALGVYVGIKACLARMFGSDSAARRHIAIQGVGKVGGRLAEHLAEEGARLTVADVDEPAVRALAARLGAAVVAPEAIHAVPADVFSPNALGAGLNDATIPQLAAPIVAGGANNQLASDRHGAVLADAGILYAPDYVINAGGVIQVADELLDGGYRPERAHERVLGIGGRLDEVFDLAAELGLPTADAAAVLAERRMGSR